MNLLIRSWFFLHAFDDSGLMKYVYVFYMQSELIVEGSIVRSGRNITVVEIQFKMKKTEKLLYTCRATFYNSHVAKL